MTRPAFPSALVVALLCAGALTATTSCSTLGLDARRETTGPAAAASAAAKPAEPSVPASAAPALTEAQAQAALVGPADLGEQWAPTQGAATWRDAFLKAKAEQPDCGRLLDALYADELLGAPARAVVGLDDGWDGAQLRHQVTARPPAEVDEALAWLGTLPRKCARFTAASSRGTRLAVTVGDGALPESGDARQGLLVTVSETFEDGGPGPDGEDGEDGGGEPVTLFLRTAAVRVGEDAFTVVTGGLTEMGPEALTATVVLGAQRLAAVRRQGRVEV